MNNTIAHALISLPAGRASEAMLDASIAIHAGGAFRQHDSSKLLVCRSRATCLRTRRRFGAKRESCVALQLSPRVTLLCKAFCDTVGLSPNTTVYCTHHPQIA